MELVTILERLRTILGAKSDRAICLELGIPANSGGNWRMNNTIPYKACLLAAQKTGYTMEWILTGEGPQKHGQEVVRIIDETKLTEDFIEVVAQGFNLKFMKMTDDTTEETMGYLAKMLFTKTTGQISIPKANAEGRKIKNS